MGVQTGCGTQTPKPKSFGREEILKGWKILIFLLVGFLAYGLLLPDLGFYWDDWPLIWNTHFQGGAAAARATLSARPFLWPISASFLQLLPLDPLTWQVWGLLVRLGTGLAAWWSLGQVWPAARRQVYITALFFLIYPGFRQQWIPVTYVNQLFLPLTATLLSIGFSLRVLKATRYKSLQLALALCFQAVGLFTTEYFLGLEFLRPAFFWICLHQRGQTKAISLRNSLKPWIPYVFLWLINLAWLYGFYGSSFYAYYPLRAWQATPWGNLIDFIVDIPRAAWVASVQAWLPRIPGDQLPAGHFWLNLLAGLSAGLLAVFAFLQMNRKVRFQIATDWSRQALLLGAFGLLLGRVPSWVAGLPVKLEFSWDRLTLPMMLGSALLTAGLLERIRWRRVHAFCLGLLTGLAVVTQLMQAQDFRTDWQRQREFFWQLAWRVPGLAPNTILLAEDLPFSFETDNSLTAPLNWTYAPHATEEIPYAILFTSIRLGGGKLPDLEPQRSVEFSYATHQFKGSTSGILAIYMPEQGCLKVLGESLWAPDQLPPLTREFVSAFPLSDPGRILIDPATPVAPPPFFDPEPIHSWCHYFEQAELARQQGDWEGVVRQGQAALSQGLSPQDPSEWLPFIQANFHSNRFSSAEELSIYLAREYPLQAKGLCTLWAEASADQDSSDQQKKLASRFYNELGCQP